MTPHYTINELYLVLNYDTNGRHCLTLTDRVQIHQTINSLDDLKPGQLPTNLSAKVASVLTEIFHQKYKRKVTKYVIDLETEKLTLIKKFI